MFEFLGFPRGESIPNYHPKKKKKKNPKAENI
jgi:hypothetical protein